MIEWFAISHRDCLLFVSLKILLILQNPYQTVPFPWLSTDNSRSPCCCSVAKWCLILCDSLDYSIPGFAAAAAAKLLQSCLTLCNPIDGSPPGSPVPGILQARTLEWVAISFSNAWKWKVKGKSLSRVRLLATPWTAAYQALLSMGFSRQEYWSGVPLPYPSIPPGVCSNSCLSSWWCLATFSSSVAPFSSCPQSFPAS